MKLEQSVVNIFRIIFIIQYIFLFAISFLFSWVNTSINDEMVYLTKDSVIANIIGLLIVLSFCYLFCKLVKRIDVDKLVICVSIIMVLFSIMWEAKARYIIPYYVLMLPYTAVGLAVLIKLDCGENKINDQYEKSQTD